MPEKRFTIVDVNTVSPVDCPCGSARRAFTEDPAQTGSLHVVEIRQHARTHYHKKMTEIYYVLQGTGKMELDGDLHDIGPGSSVMIKPGCRHRAIGEMKIINVAIPAFDPEDEWFD
jgi:mannose-6-phosphate isomerase-like protein (cupin superfamily)